FIKGTRPVEQSSWNRIGRKAWLRTRSRETKGIVKFFGASDKTPIDPFVMKYILGIHKPIGRARSRAIHVISVSCADPVSTSRSQTQGTSNEGTWRARPASGALTAAASHRNGVRSPSLVRATRAFDFDDSFTPTRAIRGPAQDDHSYLCGGGRVLPVSGKPMLSFYPFKIRSCGFLHGVDNELSNEYLGRMRYARVDKDVQGKQPGHYRFAPTVDFHIRKAASSKQRWLRILRR
ncbi:hypothetical protein CMUS01_14186, partial [Colletotrichum musicola]